MLPQLSGRISELCPVPQKESRLNDSTVGNPLLRDGLQVTKGGVLTGPMTRY
jgi:hypothetical protein